LGDKARMAYELGHEGELRLKEYLGNIGDILGNKKRRASFATYAMGLLSDAERKSVEPMAARAAGDPTRARAVMEQLLHFVAESTWDDAPVRAFAARHALAAMQSREEIEAWIIDDTGFIKQGDKSPGVQRQYTGSAGKTTNCQIATSLTVCTRTSQVPVDMDLYIPTSWTDDPARCRAAKIPDDCVFRPKWRIALDIVKRTLSWGIPPGLILADAAYGTATEFRAGIRELGLDYAVDVQSNVSVAWILPSGTEMNPMSVRELADLLPAASYRKVTWRKGTRTDLSSTFAAVRVRVVHDDGAGEHWLLVERPSGAEPPTHYVLSTLGKRLSCKELVRRVKQRWRIERTYEDLKGELGLDHFEGRTFPGWHHHVTCVLACYAFIAAEHARRFPPSGSRSQSDDPNFRAA
jgi:SRSO17 transposase